MMFINLREKENVLSGTGKTFQESGNKRLFSNSFEAL